MFIEDKLFDKKKVNFYKLLDYGFKKKKNTYEYSTNFLNVSAWMLLLPLIKRIKVPRETLVIADSSL